jgi:hypothetical protein
MKPGPSEEEVHFAPDLTDVSPTDGSESNGVSSLSVGFIWDSTSSLASIDGVEELPDEDIFSEDTMLCW